MLGIINRNFKLIDQVKFVMLYKSLVRSHSEYSVWSPNKLYLIKLCTAVLNPRVVPNLIPHPVPKPNPTRVHLLLICFICSKLKLFFLLECAVQSVVIRIPNI